MRNKSSILQSKSSKDQIIQNQNSFLKLVYVQATERDTVTDTTVQRGRRQKKTSVQESERKRTHIVNIIYDVKEREICTAQEVHLKLVTETR